MSVPPNPSPGVTPPQAFNEVLGDAVRVLRTGFGQFVEAIRQDDGLECRELLTELETAARFLETLELVGDAMSEDRLREAIRNIVKSAIRKIETIPPVARKKWHWIEWDRATVLPVFALRVMQSAGPEIRISRDEMSACVRIPAEDAGYFTAESVETSLRHRGVFNGIDRAVLNSLFRNSEWNQDILVARGEFAQLGQDGTIRYSECIRERNLQPKALEDGTVSYKDIELFTFVEAGEILATRTLPTPGRNGWTVTGHTIQSIPGREIEFPKCDHTRIDESGEKLIAESEGCVWLENGVLCFDPVVHVCGSVSFKTGNIDAQVSVLVDRDVPPAFSVQSERDISIGATVEDGLVSAKGCIHVKGGILGKGKGFVEANGDVIARFITNANVTTMSNCIVETGIIQSTVWAGGSIRVMGKNGQIEGGTVDADCDIVADIIGSEMGVKTVIRLGERQESIKNLIAETENKIEEQERAIEQCTNITIGLRERLEQCLGRDEKLAAALNRARSMGDAAQQNLSELENELRELERQYDEELKVMRTVRARQGIFPGTIILIQGAEMTFREPTGPVTIVKAGDKLVMLPYKELDA